MQEMELNLIHTQQVLILPMLMKCLGRQRGSYKDGYGSWIYPMPAFWEPPEEFWLNIWACRLKETNPIRNDGCKICWHVKITKYACSNLILPF